MRALRDSGEDHAPRFAILAFAAIALLLGALYWASARVETQRMEARARAEAQGVEVAAEPPLLEQVISMIHMGRSSHHPRVDGVWVNGLRFGAVAIAAAWLWCIAVAWGISAGWGLFLLFVPGIGLLAFSAAHPREAREPLVVLFFGVCLVLHSGSWS